MNSNDHNTEIETLHAGTLRTVTGGWYMNYSGAPAERRDTSDIYQSEQGALYCSTPGGAGPWKKDWRCEGRNGPLPLELRREPHEFGLPVPPPSDPRWGGAR